MMTLQSLFIPSIFSFQFQDLIQYFIWLQVQGTVSVTCNMMYSGLCRKTHIMSLTLALEKLFTLTLCFWDSRPGCKPETTESPTIHIVPCGHGQSSIVRCHGIVFFFSVSYIQFGEIWIYLCRLLLLNIFYIAIIFHNFVFEIQSSDLSLIQSKSTF